MRLAGAVALAVAACGQAPAATHPPSTGAAREAATTRATSAASAPSAKSGGSPATAASPAVTASSGASAPTERAVLLVTRPRTLSRLEARGLTAASFFGAQGDDAAALASTPSFAPIVRAIEREAAALARRDPSAGVEVGRYPHRLFDVRWLREKSSRFELVGVTNRFDRAPFVAGSCGETRLIYRLSYATSVGAAEVASRLPMTLGVELVVPDDGDGCRSVLRRWRPAALLGDEALADFLTGPTGPLSSAAIDAARRGRHQVVTNTQLVRWPSTVRPDLGGHAEYLLLAFSRTPQGSYVPAPLENTPDLAKLQRDAALRKELLQALSSDAALRAIDAGTFVLDARFLAERAVSVTPRGLARGQNRPFSSLFAERDFRGLTPPEGRHVRSLEGLLRRLDELSCQGCHEARSIAGFHLLGDDPAEAPAGTALATGTSPHLAGDLARRASVVATALRGESPDFMQGFPERSGSGGYGAHCGLDGEPTFRAWNCDAGLACRPYDAPKGEHVGQCLPAVPRGAGDPCETGPLDPRAGGGDRVSAVTRESCAGSAVCNRNAVGFPGGMCTEACDALSPASTCGRIAILEPFNACVARGEPFAVCLASHARPAGLRACSPENPCRDDYVCARTETGGACIPPYFLFQLRVDGHP